MHESLFQLGDSPPNTSHFACCNSSQLCNNWSPSSQFYFVKSVTGRWGQEKAHVGRVPSTLPVLRDKENKDRVRSNTRSTSRKRSATEGGRANVREGQERSKREWGWEKNLHLVSRPVGRRLANASTIDLQGLNACPGSLCNLPITIVNHCPFPKCPVWWYTNFVSQTASR